MGYWPIHSKVRTLHLATWLPNSGNTSQIPCHHKSTIHCHRKSTILCQLSPSARRMKKSLRKPLLMMAHTQNLSMHHTNHSNSTHPAFMMKRNAHPAFFTTASVLSAMVQKTAATTGLSATHGAHHGVNKAMFALHVTKTTNAALLQKPLYQSFAKSLFIVS